MSYIPLRDTFALPEATQTVIFELIERMEVEERAELHKDQCMCDGGPDACLSASSGFFASLLQPSPEFVVAWLLREGLITMERLNEEAER